MPLHTPFVKVENTRRFGARGAARGRGRRGGGAATRGSSPRREGLTFVHPFDDAAVIAGQGTLGLEMLEAAPDLDVLVVPIGGGGLIGGIATAAKALRPGDRGRRRRGRALPLGLPPPARPAGRWRAGRRSPRASRSRSRATSPTRSSSAWSTTCCWSRRRRSRPRSCSCSRSRRPWPRAPARPALRPSPATRTASAAASVGLVLCGGNIDSRLLSAVILRGLVRTQRLVRLRLGVPDSPGSLVRIATIIAEQRRQHRRRHPPARVLEALGQAGRRRLHDRDAGPRKHAEEIATALRAADFAVIRLDDGGQNLSDSRTLFFHFA